MQSSSFGLKRILTLGLPCWTLILFTGCLESDITRHIKYKASDDSFEILSVFNHIRGKSTDDLDHAAELYEVRSDLINPIAPLTLFAEPAWIRKGDSKYLATNLGAGPEGTPAPKTTKIALDSITVKPGKFFFNKNGMPAYYHRIVLPGAAFDGFLARFSSSINEGIVDSIEKRTETQGGRQPGSDMGKPASQDIPRALRSGSDKQDRQPPLEPFTRRLPHLIGTSGRCIKIEDYPRTDAISNNPAAHPG